MNFMATGSIYSYTQNLKLAQRWKIKKNNGNYLQKNSSASTDEGSDPAVHSELELFRSQLDQFQQQTKPDLLTLYSKLSSGKKLSAEELAYLREHDPTSYQKAKEMEADRENYKRELRQCRTKEDVERLRTNRIAACFAAASSISHNSHLPKLTKMHLMAAECAKVQAIDEETRLFKASLGYAHMPTDAEQNEENKKKLEALRGEVEETHPEKAQEEKSTSGTDASAQPEKESTTAKASKDLINADKAAQPEKEPNTAKTSSKDLTNADEAAQPKKEPTTAKASKDLTEADKAAQPEHTNQKTESAADEPVCIRQKQSFPKAVSPYHTAYGRELYKKEAETSAFPSQKRRKKT